MTQADQVRIALIGAPLVAGVALIVIAITQQRRFAADTESRQKVETQIASVQDAMAKAQQIPPQREAAVKDEPTEESTYLTFIRSAALSNGVKIIRWAANPRVPDVPGGPPPPAAIADVVSLSGNLEIAGPYRSVLSFTRQLETNHRLYNLSNVSWNRPENGFDVHLTTMVTRYVLKGPPPAPVTPPNP